ncbi:phospholipase D-like domain-containing protein [Sphingomonas sp. BAUL-RG-20F-R05-02]|uniref:phospholipase D-like domain-containing protein n=1 Tax=Sphingomonas sp. BAUL-RG-20F-R05-02 TaxID=2914830 RepID=UPI001F566809|nr:phospholipase D-like domain-containing protein [Sphingomonas sp. BAUL-RG-20F-R05-02]
MSVIVDADDYFRNARAAMLKAQRRIMLIGWDFDARIELTDQAREDGEPRRVGDFIYWLIERNPQLEVYLLRWDVGALKTLMRGSNIAMILRWMRHPRIHTRLDGFHPPAASHHQKIVVIDDCLAFCGGIDMTSERWDTRAHRDDEPGRVTPRGKPYKPWHDATTALQGPIAATLGELARDRWSRAGGGEIAPITTQADCWPDLLTPDFRDVEVGIARTRPDMPDCPEIREIEGLFVAQIAGARTSIYAESQYFAARRIAEAIGARLAEPDCPEIVIINPRSAQGWLEPVAMDTARARLFAALKQRDRNDRLRLYHPYTAGGEAIYVHAKVMIVDGQTLRIGSANMNNRSMGLDTECDVMIDAGDEGAQAICAIRDGLISEHLGVPTDRITTEIAARGSIIATIEALRGDGRSLRPYEVPDLNVVETWLADNEVLDPESPSEMFEATSKRGLFRRLRHPFG